MSDNTQWKVVPVEPTREMLDKAHADLVRNGEIDLMLKHVWSSMIAAAPASAVEGLEVVAYITDRGDCLTWERQHDDDVHLVRQSDTARVIAERDARIADLGARLDATQSMFMSAIRDLAAINVRLCCDPDEGGAVPIIEAIDELKRMVADQASKGQRLALELECLLLDIKDNAIVSKWWDSALDAIEDWRKV